MKINNHKTSLKKYYIALKKLEYRFYKSKEKKIV